MFFSLYSKFANCSILQYEKLSKFSISPISITTSDSFALLVKGATNTVPTFGLQYKTTAG